MTSGFLYFGNSLPSRSPTKGTLTFSRTFSWLYKRIIPVSHLRSVWYFFVFSPGSRFPLELFVKQDRCFLTPTADFLGFGQRQNNCFISRLNSQSFNVASSPLGFYDKRRSCITIENDTVAGDVLLW